MAKYTKKNSRLSRVPKGFGFEAKVKAYQKDLTNIVREHGRAIVGVVADEAPEGSDGRYFYTVPIPNGEEPTLLTSYPGNTASWLLNRIGDDFKNGVLSLPKAGETTEVRGYIGENGVLPLRLKTLRADQAEFAYREMTCQSFNVLPVVIVELPDPSGRWAENAECDPRVALATEFLNAVFSDDEDEQDAFLVKMDELKS
jgi:hypothetical protein